jgi:hypothetical protein
MDTTPTPVFTDHRQDQRSPSKTDASLVAALLGDGVPWY